MRFWSDWCQDSKERRRQTTGRDAVSEWGVPGRPGWAQALRPPYGDAGVRVGLEFYRPFLHPLCSQWIIYWTATISEALGIQ